MNGHCKTCGESSNDCKCNAQYFHDANCPCHGTPSKIEKLKKIATTLKFSDPINHPSHYQGNKFEVIDIIEDFNLDFSTGNAIKYILRAGKKGNKLDDLKKAIWYLKRICDKYQIDKDDK